MLARSRNCGRWRRPASASLPPECRLEPCGLAGRWTRPSHFGGPRLRGAAACRRGRRAARRRAAGRDRVRLHCSAYVQGAESEAAMLDRLSERGHGLPVVAPCAGSVEALRRLDVQRMVLFSPPWFDAELNALGRGYYETAGFDVISAERCELPSAQTSISPSAMAEAVLTKTAHDAE